MGFDAATPPGLWERIRTLVQEEVGKLLRSGLLRNASISEGGLTIKGGFLKLQAPGAAADTVYVGGVNPPAPDGSLQPGFVLRRNDGTIAFLLRDGSPTTDGYYQHWNFYDRAGNVIVSEDATSGQGIATPYVPVPLYPGLGVNTLPAGTTSTSFTALWIARAPKQQPRLALSFLATAPAGTTGEVRATVGASALGAGAVVTGGALLDATFLGPVDGAHMSEMRINLEARVTSGPGPITVYPVRCEGRQSA